MQQEAVKAQDDESKLPQLLELRTSFRHHVQKFRAHQANFTPGVLALLAQEDATRVDIPEIEATRLGLPSQIDSSDRATTCPANILTIEARLRDAQCRDALQDLRNQLHAQHRLWTLKKLHVRYQGPSTRSRTDLDSQGVRVRRAAEKYRRARRAKLALIGPGLWEREFQVLTDNDIRAVQDDDPDAVAERARKQKRPGPAEGYRMMSWIWRGADSDEGGFTESLRIEWTQLRARVRRWMEEKRLLPEEMRRVLVFLAFQEEEWKGRIGKRPEVEETLQEGLTAYAHKQAAQRRQLRGSFRQIWLPLAKDAGVELGEEWALVSGYMPRKIRRRFQNKVTLQVEEKDIAEGEEGLQEGEQEVEDEAAVYRRMVEGDLADVDPYFVVRISRRGNISLFLSPRWMATA